MNLLRTAILVREAAAGRTVVPPTSRRRAAVRLVASDSSRPTAALWRCGRAACHPISCPSGSADAPVRLPPTQLKHNGEWRGVCGRLFDAADADVVCRQLGFEGYMRFSPFVSGGPSYWLQNVEVRDHPTPRARASQV